MTNEPPAFNDAANAWLDGERSPEQREAFERACAADPALRAGVDRLAAAERELCEAYAPPARVPRWKLRTREVERAWWRHPAAVAAAAAVLFTAGIWFTLAALQPSEPAVDAAAAHASFARTRHPAVVCDTPEKFAAYTREHLGTEITARFDAGVTLVGWRTLNGADYYKGDRSGLAPKALLAEVRDSIPIVVVFVELDRPAPVISGDPSLRMFSKVLGGVTAWEVTPLEQPLVLDVIELASDG